MQGPNKNVLTSDKIITYNEKIDCEKVYRTKK